MIEDANYLAVSFPRIATGKPGKSKAGKKGLSKAEEKPRDPEAMNLWQKV